MNRRSKCPTVLLILIATVACAGCATRATIRPFAPVPRTEVVFEKNFIEGVRSRAFVGEPVLKIRSYSMSLQALGHAEPNQTFNVPWGTLFGGVDVEAGRQYKIVGTTVLDGREFFVVLVPAGLGQSIALLVGPDGVIHRKILNMGATDALGWAMTGVGGAIAKGVVVDLDFDAAAARLTPVVTKRVVSEGASSEPYVNMELLYLGVSSGALRLGYREYTQDDLARPAYSQELTYDRGSDAIRFRRFELNVHEANGDHMDYTVVPQSDSPETQR